MAHKGFIDDFRITRGVKVTWADDRRCIYRSTLVWTPSIAQTHQLGEWGEWVEIPFLFIPKRSFDNKLVWGRNIQVRIKPQGVSFTTKTIDAEVMYDTKKAIFMRKLKGGA
jgi:hypothetical protein